MELDLQALFARKQESEEGDASFDFSGRDFGGFSIKGPLHVNYHAVAENASVCLTMMLKVQIEADCARCARPLEKEWILDRTFHIAPSDLQEEFLEFPFTNAGGIDLEELSYSELLMDVDSVLLCKDTCKGLCIACGCPKDECLCKEDDETQQVDPRWQALRDLLNEEDTL